MEIALILIKAFLEYGILGLVCVFGWVVAGVLLYKDHKRKDKVSLLVEEKEAAVIKAKDDMAREIKELSEKRLEDLREITTEYNQLAAHVTKTLEKLTESFEESEHDNQRQ